MNADKSRVIVTVMREGEEWRWVARYNPGGGAPNLQAEGQSNKRGMAFRKAIDEVEKFIHDDEGTR